MKIIFLDFDDIKNPLLAAGQARATVEIGKRLIKKGHKIKVISSKYPGYKNRIENGIEYYHIGLGTKNIRLNNLIYIILLPFYVSNIRDADVIVECFTSPISTLYSPVFTKIPVVAVSTSFEAERFSKLYHLPFHIIEKYGLHFYKYFAPLNFDHEEKMKRQNPKIISKVIPEGVDSEYFNIKLKKPEYILFLGRLDVGQKGIDLLLKAYAKISKQVKYPLVIAGNGPDEAKIKKQIQDLKIEDKVKLIGPAYGKKKNDVLSKALCVAFPSRHEGFSVFALEAVATGLPLVSFDIPGLYWTDKRSCVKAKPFNINEYAKFLVEFSKEKLITKTRGRYREFAKKFTWDMVTHDFETFFMQILKKEGELKHV